MTGRPAMSQTGPVGSEPAPSGGFLDSEEIVAALDSLSARRQAQALRDRKGLFSAGRTCQPEDLLHEAMCAVIMGDRKCPRTCLAHGIHRPDHAEPREPQKGKTPP